jgi:hypothetical protein
VWNRFKPSHQFKPPGLRCDGTPALPWWGRVHSVWNGISRRPPACPCSTDRALGCAQHKSWRTQSCAGTLLHASQLIIDLGSARNISSLRIRNTLCTRLVIVFFLVLFFGFGSFVCFFWFGERFWNAVVEGFEFRALNASVQGTLRRLCVQISIGGGRIASSFFFRVFCFFTKADPLLVSQGLCLHMPGSPFCSLMCVCVSQCW